jgi:Myb-like DNA-binding domain
MEIAKCLPHRSVQSVYRHGIRQLHPFNRGAWCEEECEILQDLVQKLGKKWSAIQGKLNRSADSCRDKYREMSDEYTKGRWKDTETEMLKKIIREHLQVDAEIDMQDLGKMVEEQNIQISWSAISKRMGKRSRLSCFKKWQKMTGVPGTMDEHKRKASDELDQYDALKRPKLELQPEYDEAYSAKMADETVEALGLPDAVTLVQREPI